MSQNSYTAPTTVYEVGKFYRVPCVKASGNKYQHIFRSQWVPIMGPEHQDAEIIGFPYRHWHVDWRFAGQRMFTAAKKEHPGRNHESDVYNYVLMRFASFDRSEDLRNPFVETGEVVVRRMQCKRAFPAYPHERARWLPRLEEHCAGLKMRGMVCPHRGVPLEGCPTDGDVVQCPGHGLRWNVKTGELVQSCVTTATKGRHDG